MNHRSKKTSLLSAERKELLKQLKQQEGITSAPSIPPLKPVERQEGELFPLAFAQQRLWLLDQLNPGISAYTIPLALYLSGQIDSEALRNAVREVVRRHEAVR